MNLWSVEHFLIIFVITFGWVQQQSNSKATANSPKSDDKNARNVQLIRGSFGKEILLIKSILYLCPYIMKSSEYRNSYSIWQILWPHFQKVCAKNSFLDDATLFQFHHLFMTLAELGKTDTSPFRLCKFLEFFWNFVFDFNSANFDA